jgi:glycosyltransferase involved in cell wall biosynthesis
MKKLSDLPLNLELYIPSASPVIKKVILGQTNILLTSAPPGAMPQIQSQATLLFLPLAWNTKAPDIIATATPGKFTDYLASGRPMLIHAPDYAYVSRYGKENNLGLVVDQNSVDALAKAIRDFLADPAQGQKYIDNALRVFHQNHDAHKNAIKLTELLKMV